MAIKVYTISGAPRGWRVLVGLALKGIEADVRYLQASEGEHKQSDFLKINPRGMIPVIEHNGVTVRDSIAILAWLDREFPDKPLFGQTSEEARNIWQITMECCDYLRDAVNGLLQPVLVRNIDLPNDGSDDMNNLRIAGEKTHAECGYLEKLLGSGPFLAGTTPSAAEAIAFPDIRLIQRALERKPEIMRAVGFGEFNERYPKLVAWRDRTESLPSMGKTLPYHWSE